MFLTRVTHLRLQGQRCLLTSIYVTKLRERGKPSLCIDFKEPVSDFSTHFYFFSCFHNKNSSTSFTFFFSHQRFLGVESLLVFSLIPTITTGASLPAEVSAFLELIGKTLITLRYRNPKKVWKELRGCLLFSDSRGNWQWMLFSTGQLSSPWLVSWN